MLANVRASRHRFVSRRLPLVAATVVSFTVVLAAFSRPLDAKTWRKLYSEEGVTVSAMDRPESGLPVLRGTCMLRANLYLLLAIVDDLPRHPEWIHRLETSRMLQRPDPFHARVHIGFDFPWPTSDRDSVVEVVIERRWKPHHEVMIRFWRTRDPRAPKRKGVVRIPRSRGFTRLRWLGPNRTHVVYQIDTDPGGWLPKWIVRWISKSLPLKVVRGLRKQLVRRRNDYAAFVRLWDPRQTVQKDALPGFALPGVNMATVPGRVSAR